MTRSTLLILAAFALTFLLRGVTFAQTEEPPANTPITYGSRVEGDLSGQAFWDWWVLQAAAGDRMIVQMNGTGGLAPLIGILGPGGTLVARSDDGDPDGTVDLTFVVPESGRYTLVTTRAGNANGTTTGHYVLFLGLDNPSTPQPTPLAPVTFQCGSAEATSAISLRFSPNVEAVSKAALRITVIGLGGFEPAISLSGNVGDSPLGCDPATDGVDGDRVSFPGEAALYSTGLRIARASIPPAKSPDTVRLTIGSVGGKTGRYMVIISGFSLVEPSSRAVPFDVRLGPRAAPGADALVYMLAADGSRVDPSVTNGDESLRCDDAARRGCDDVPPVTNAGFVGPDFRVTGHRFDAGQRIARGSSEPQVVVMRSFDDRTQGPFNVLITGELVSE